MSTSYRYRWTGLNLKSLRNDVGDSALTFGAASNQPIIDVNLSNTSRKSDLDLVMSQMHFEFVGTSPTTTTLAHPTRVIFVDPNSPVASTSQDGSISLPFSTIAAALAYIGQPTSLDDQRLPWVIYLAPAEYAEDIFITQQRMLIIRAWGYSTIGTNTTARNLVINNGPAIFSGEVLVACEFIGITGDVKIIDTVSAPVRTQFVWLSPGEINKIDGTTSTGQIELVFDSAGVAAAGEINEINAPTATLTVHDTRAIGPTRIHRYGRIESTTFRGAITVLDGPEDSASIFRNCEFIPDTGTITYTSPNVFRVDDESLNSFVLNNSILAGGAFVEQFGGVRMLEASFNTNALKLAGATPVANFNIGNSLPNGARVLRSEIEVKQALSASGLTNAASGMQAVSEPANSLVAGGDIMAVGFIASPGSNPYVSRGGQQLQITVKLTGANLNNLTAGSLKARVWYTLN